MNAPKLSMLLLDNRLAVCQLDRGAAVPSWAIEADFFSITRTADELSIVCPKSAVPPDVKVEKGWRCFRVAGSMDFSVVGVLASMTGPLAEAGVGIFAVSTFDTDYLLVKETDLDRAIGSLVAHGHSVASEDRRD